MTNKYKKVEDIIVRRLSNTRSGSTSYKGVGPTKKGRFDAHFSMSNKDCKLKLHLGVYDTAEEAYIARLKFIDSLK